MKRERRERKTSRLQAQHHPHQEGLALCLKVILDSGAHRWVQAGHPRYTGASTEEGRGWPDVTSTKTTNDNRRQDTDKRQDKRACNDQVLRNVNSHTAELGFLHGSGAGSQNWRSTESCRNPKTHVVKRVEETSRIMKKTTLEKINPEKINHETEYIKI